LAKSKAEVKLKKRKKNSHNEESGTKKKESTGS